MGDRANVKLVYEKGEEIYLYTHWGGTDLPITLASALSRGQSRWNDPPYLARIIFSEMVKGQEMNLIGYGISPYVCDEEHPHLIVNLERKTVNGEDYQTFIERISRQVGKLETA